MVTHGRGIRPFEVCIESRVSERRELIQSNQFFLTTFAERIRITLEIKVVF